jgi:hypothetical protein
MVKTPKTRHSKPKRAPLTIDLDPKEVSLVAGAEATDSLNAAPVTEGTAPADAIANADERPPFEAAYTTASADSTIDQVSEATSETTSSTETGTAPQPDQEFQPFDGNENASGYRFDEDDRAKPTARSAPFESSAERAPPPPASGGVSRIAAGVIGAVVALAGAGVLQYAGMLGYPGASGSTASNTEIATLQQQVDALKQGSANGDAARFDELSSTVEAVRAELTGVKESLSTGAGGETAGLQALDERIKAIESSIAGLNQGGTTETAGLAELGDRVGAIESSVKSATDTASAADGKLAAVEKSIADLDARVDAQAQQPKIALAISTAALKSAIDRGAPFAAELETFAAIAPAAPGLAELRAHAEAGIPTRDDLMAEVEPAAAAMIAAETPVDPNAGYFDRLLQSAESLVTVRPVGEVAGTGAGAVVARMQVALKAGDLDKAYAEFESLPEPVRAAAGDFGRKLQTRRDVEKLADQAIAGAAKA